MSKVQAIETMKNNKHGRIFNFSAGPATLPEAVLEQVQTELLNYHGAGMSIMEMSHRSKEFDEVLNAARDNLRKLMGISDEYEVLFLQGGATQQFALAPMNFYQDGKPIEFVHTGQWTKKAIAEGKKIAEVKTVASGEDKNFTELPEVNASTFSDNASYVHWCSNNTIFGTQWKQWPSKGKSPWVVDMSSDFLSRKIDYSQFDLIFAGAQKNVGPSGLTVAVIKKSWAEKGSEKLPNIFRYQAHIEGDSRLNTPPTFGIYIAGLVFQWLLDQGGIEKIEKQNEEKAGWLYEAIDQSSLYKCPIKKEDRSPMNVVFRVNDDEELEKKFIAEASAQGLSGLKGHRSIGGLRASIYNAHPVEGVKALVEFMKDFEKKA